MKKDQLENDINNTMRDLYKLHQIRNQLSEIIAKGSRKLERLVTAYMKEVEGRQEQEKGGLDNVYTDHGCRQCKSNRH